MKALATELSQALRAAGQLMILPVDLEEFTAQTLVTKEFDIAVLRV